MEQWLEDALPHFLLQYAGYILVSLTRMDDKRQAGFTRCCNMRSKTMLLRRARAQVIVVVKSRFADANRFGMLGKSDEISDRNVKFLMGMVRMGSDGAEHIRVALGNAEQAIKFLDLRTYRDNEPDAGGFGIGQHLRQPLCEPLIVQVAVAIDNQKAQFFAGASPSST